MDKEHRAATQALSADNKIGSHMNVDFEMSLRKQDCRTLLDFLRAWILRKLVALGHDIIKRKDDQVLDEFAQAVNQMLEGNL